MKFVILCRSILFTLLVGKRLRLVDGPSKWILWTSEECFLYDHCEEWSRSKVNTILEFWLIFGIICFANKSLIFEIFTLSKWILKSWLLKRKCYFEKTSKSVAYAGNSTTRSGKFYCLDHFVFCMHRKLFFRYMQKTKWSRQ